MVVLILIILTNVVASLTLSAMHLLMPCMVLLVGLIIMLSAVGLKVSQNLGSTIIKAVFSAIAFIVKGALKMLPILVKTIIYIVRNAFIKTRNLCKARGFSDNKSDFIAIIITIIVIVIII